MYQRIAPEKRLDRFAPQIKEMVGKQFSGTRIFQELTDSGYSGSLTSVYRYVRQFQDRADHKTTIRFETGPGQQMQYDWKEWQVLVAGKPLKLYFHQAILSFSRYKFVTFSLDVSTPTIIRVLMQALAAFQGVPEEMVIDNPKQMVLSHDRQGVVRYQDDFLAFLGCYGLKPDPCQPYRARTKGKVENPCFYLQEHFRRGLEVEHLDDLEERLALFMGQYNARPHSTTGQAPVPLAMAGKKVWIERVLGRWLEILAADFKPLARYELLPEHPVTLPHPEHPNPAREFLDRKEPRRLPVKVVFQDTSPPWRRTLSVWRNSAAATTPLTT